ncbi:ESCRT-III subunit protein snf7 [Tulasnella sp. JGI-2019a]|nr:ESCRT-III subunit protein snf7 [Tulasnella sp. JGI-2019a]KAG9014229.1 ESCRT-III subunit protein snf7 [Tulasnella sp. JGI-2019a]KAG9035950.1 ESCRT-III subunit protein snf7 [Tulasnella sp. JGI-2019a]
MSGWMSYFGGRKDPKSTTREAIVTLRQQLQMLEKKEDYLMKKIDEETKKAKTNAISNKPAALAALRRKKQFETELDRLGGTRLTLETQVNAIENANINSTTMEAMKRGADALKVIHGSLSIDKVDATMDSIREQMELTNEISDAISNPLNVGIENDEEALKAQLDELEQEKLDEVLMGADRVPQHSPAGKTVVAESHKKFEEESEEDRELRELQASLAM